MRAIAIGGFASVGERVGIVTMPRPEPEAGEIRIAVRAAGLNPADWKLAEGWLQPAFTPAFPYALGFDAAGIVESVGAGVTGLAIGARVVAKTAVGRGGAGALADFVTVAAHLACELPDGLDPVEAAALPTAGITAWEALFDSGGLAAGQWLLVNGGAGGTGSYAIALARMAGARIAATAGAANQDYLRALGVDLALDYRRDWIAELRDAVPHGVDLLLDTVGQGVLADPLGSIRDGGALITIGTLVRGEARPSEAAAQARTIRVAIAGCAHRRSSA
jgi:NADPH2:quinone reductase